ncbi:2-hydroxyacid dehydrogenase [Rhodocytophaga aerolata]|uniref:2-hydroxyacid dehydrogenase n=1 Tax=Rhodocytophaga aerolata TaxID=455078 RepID=A0ABT8R6A3_9BACT|nr:2-hydroxyacid dehydrogenase [Rhodocytophaga aerolata]MDO1447633.1 2-hydroxyacid dehydrogenase [Rhodocytophaga aerolata]
MTHILVVDEMHPSLLPMLSAKGIQADYKPAFVRKDILENIAPYDGIIIRSKTVIDEEILSRATNLKFIGRAGAGLDQMDLEAIEKRNIQVFNAPEGNRDAVGEHALTMLLCLFNNILQADKEVRAKNWKREANRGIELGGRTVAIIGYGNTGNAFARRLSGFNCRVLAYDKYLSTYTNSYAQEATMEQIFEQADVLSLHIPLTPETLKLVNTEFINRFRKNIFIINTARGEIISLPDLAKAVEAGKVRGACLDVLENEKLQTLTDVQEQAFSFLSGVQNVIFSPHVAGWTHESYVRINEVLVEKIARFINQS